MVDTFIEDTDANYLLVSRIAYNAVTLTTDKILLQASTIKYDVGTYTQTPEQPGRGQSTLTDNISYGDFLGFSNPKITVHGVIDLRNYTDGTTSPAATAGYKLITLKLLQQIFKSGHVFTLTDQLTASTPSVYRMHSLTSSDAISTIKVMCAGMSADVNVQNNEARLDYSIEFVEVRG
jgi:hypothetical protein